MSTHLDTTMSLGEASKRFIGPPPSEPRGPYPPDDGSRDRRMFPNPPSLPSMASLLSGPEQMQTEQEPQAYPPHSFPPPHRETRHPLFLSEMNPSAPVQHIYQGPQDNVPHYREAPRLVSIQPASGLTARVEQTLPIVQRRQVRKISQRRDDVEKDDVEPNMSPATGQARSNEPESGSRPRPQEIAPYSRKDSIPFEPSMQRVTPPREAQNASVPISGLLSGASSELPRIPPKYHLTVRQQPIAARACGFGERDRRVIDPPPILQLAIEDPTATPEELSAKLRQPYLVVHCTLWDPVADRDDTAMPGSVDKRQQRRLMGTLVSSPFVGKDEHDVEGCFFTFPDLSVRTPGTYSLKFSLVVLDPTKMVKGAKAPINATVKSNAFSVFNAKDFGGMRASTELTKRLKHQGCLISVKKGNAKSNHVRDEDDDEEEEDEDETRKVPPAKRGKR